jgi:hypothetical protein
MATAMGHRDQQRKNARSTKPLSKPTIRLIESNEWILVRNKNRPQPLPTILEETQAETSADTQESIRALEDQVPAQDEAHYYAFSSLVDIEQTGKSYSDLTGRFPVRSERGNLYVLVVYLYDDNAILVEPIKNRGEAGICQVVHGTGPGTTFCL